MNRRPPASAASSSSLSPPRTKRSPSVYSIFRPTTTKTTPTRTTPAMTTAATMATPKSPNEPSHFHSEGTLSPSSPILVSGRGDEERGGDCRGCGADSDVEVRDGHGRDCNSGSQSHLWSGNPFDFVTGANSNSNSNNNNNTNNSNCPNQHVNSLTDKTTPVDDIFASLFQWNSSPPSKNTNNNLFPDAKSSTPIANQSSMPKTSQIQFPSKTPSTTAPATTTLRQSLPPRHPKLPTAPAPTRQAAPASTTTATMTSAPTAASVSPAQMSRNKVTSSSAFDPFFVVFHPVAESNPNHVDHEQHHTSPSTSSLPLPPPPPPPFPTTNPPLPTTPHDQTPSSIAEETHDTATTHGSTAFHDLANSFFEKVEDFATSFPEVGYPCSPFGGYVPEARGEDAGVIVAGSGASGHGPVPSSAVKARTGCRTAGEDGASTTSAASSFLEFVGEVTTSLNPFFSFGEHNDVMEGDGDGAENDDDDNGVGGAKRSAEGWDVHVGKDVRANRMPEYEFLEASKRSNSRQNHSTPEDSTETMPGGRKRGLHKREEPSTLSDRQPPRLPPLTCSSSSMQPSRECHVSNSSLVGRGQSPLPILRILPSKYHDEWNAISSYPSYHQQHQMMETSPSFPHLGLDALDETDHRRNAIGGADNEYGQLRQTSRSVDSEIILHGEVQSLGKNRTRCNTLDNHTILMSSSYYPNDNSQHFNRKRTTTIESVMAVISLTSTAKSVASPWKDGKSSNCDSGGTTTIENDESGPVERGKGSANVVVVHQGNAEGLEASVAVAHEDGVEWFDGEEGRAPDGAAAFWDPAGRRDHRHVTPMKAIYPIPPLCRTTSDGDYDDASAVSSLSDDERYGFQDDEHDGTKAARKKKHYRKHSSSDRGSSEVIGSGGAPPSGGGVRAISAFLKKPVELANKMGATGAAIVRQPSTARDTVTTAATTTAHTLETINTPKTPMGEEFLSTWRNMGQNTSYNDSFTSFGHSPGRANSVNSIGSDTFTSQKGYHRRCRYGMNGLDFTQRHSLRNVNTRQQSMGDEVSWFAPSPGMPLSPGARPSIPSPGSIMYENALINYKRTAMAPRLYPLMQQPSPMRRPSPSPPVSPRMNSKDLQGIPPPIVFNACENSVVSGTSSTGWTLRSNDQQIQNSGTMSTSSISNGALGARPMTRSSSISHSFQRPPMATRAKSVQEVFDPFSEMNSQFGNLSTGTPSSNPPRYLKDDPLLSTSRYRGSRLIASPSIRKPKKSIKKSKEKHVIDRESACMIGTIALAETDPLSPLKCGGISQRSFTNTQDCITPQGTFDSLNSPHDASTTPNSHQISPSLKIDEVEDDDATCEFAEEFHRRDKSNVVKEEIKHFIGKFKPKPVVKVGKKLLGRESPSKNLKRADGCLT